MTMLKHKDYDIFSLKYVTASFFATYFSGIVHPLDIVKTRFQSKTIPYVGHDGKASSDNLVPKYNGIKNALEMIYKN